VAYWLFLLATAVLVVAGTDYFWGTPALDQDGFVLVRHAAAVIALVVLLPLVLYDVVAMTNRFAGPVYRLRRSLAALAAGERVAPLQFRENDYWRELADEFNAVVAYVDELKEQADAAHVARSQARDFQPVGSE
jgi:hypothetical protein